MLILLLALIASIRRNLVLVVRVLLFTLNFISTLLKIIQAELLTSIILQLIALLCFNLESERSIYYLPGLLTLTASLAIPLAALWLLG